MAKQIQQDYKGDEELLVLGLACPGFWRQQYELGKKMGISDVSTAKYALMTLEWAKKMGLNEDNAIMMGHSAGAEAATYLSKWFKVIALSASLHINFDEMFLAIAGVDAGAQLGNFIIGTRNVDKIKEPTIRTLTGAEEDSAQMQMHMVRKGDGEGWSFDKKVWELCLADKIPDFKIDPSRISLMGGDRDILTSYQKKKAWFKKWLQKSEYKKGEVEKMWGVMTDWFSQDIGYRLKHDQVLLDELAIKAVSKQVLRVLPTAKAEAVKNIPESDFVVVGNNLDEAMEMDSQKKRAYEQESLITRREKYRELTMSEYIGKDLFGLIDEFLSKIPTSNAECETWFKQGSEGSDLWRGVVAEVLQYSGQFSEQEINNIREGSLKLTDESIRERVMKWPPTNEWEGWMILPDFQLDEVRGAQSRGILLDASLYNLNDILLRKMAGMSNKEELPFEHLAYDPSDRRKYVWDRLREWRRASWNS